MNDPETMNELETKRKARKAARSWLTRDIKKLEQILNGEEPSKQEVKACLDSLERRMINLETVQGEVECLLPDEEMEKDIDEAAEHIDRYMSTKLRAEEILGALSVNDNKEAETVSLSGGPIMNPSGANVNLPKLNLPHFNGNPLDFFSFWERFDVAVDSTNIPDVNKFIYLKSVLEGDALAAVRGLAVTPNNYAVAKEIIVDRFGRKEKVIFHHVESLLNFKDLKHSKSVKELWAFRDEIHGHIRSLQALNIGGEQYGVFLTPIILNKLPTDVRMEWARSEGKESDIQFLMDFLYEEIKRKERSMMFHQDSSASSESAKLEQKGWHSRKTASTFLAQNKQFKPCIICEKTHKGKPEDCFKFLKSSKRDRAQMIKSKNLCFACFDPNHRANACQKKCKQCHGAHNELICNKSENESLNTEQSSGSTEQHVLNHALISKKNCNTLLQVLKVNVKGVNGSKTCVNVLLDGGSDHTYVTSEVIRAVEPHKKGEVHMSFSSFGCEKPSPMKSRNFYSLDFEGENGVSLRLDATEIPTICTPVYRPKLPSDALRFVQNFPLCVNYEKSDHVKIDVLIGIDQLWTVLKGDVISIPSTNLVLQQSVFGWVVSGSFQCTSNSGNACMVSHQLHCCQQSIPHFQTLWDLDSIGIREEESVRDDDMHVMQNFEETVTFEEGRYKVKLPWKDSCSENLLDNEIVAKKRLTNLMNRLQGKPQLLCDYLKVFSEMEQDGIIVEVPKENQAEGKPIFYLPHHPVVKETSLTTKVRPVFDASCPGVNGVSLNDCLWAGPCLLPDLIAVLLRFRRWPIALTADVKQAFLNIRVHSEDTDVHRFLLPSSDGFKVMKFVRVPFGNKASPFLLNATVKYHLSKYEETTTVKELRESLYVDDWLTGSNTAEECIQMVEEANDIMSSASLPLTKWASNDDEVNEHLKVMGGSERDCLIIQDSSFKVLGIQWNRETDCLVFQGLIMEASGCPSKRAVLSLIARLFDPLGLLSPFIMSIKILFQDIWRDGLEWDQPLPLRFRERLDRWMEGLTHIKQFHVVRSYFSGHWDPGCVKGLFCFCDASEKAYGACVYIAVCHLDGSCSSTLVYAKAKVAPLKTMSLPRLELLGALLAARLGAFVKSSLRLDDDTPCVHYTDSMVALAWIRGNPTRWKTFVSNRVIEIQKLTKTENWYHVPGKENPADMISRGVSGEALVNSSLWLQGPTWLGSEIDNTSDEEECDNVEERVANELASSKQLATQTENSRVLDLSRWGSFKKTMRVVAWILRFVNNARCPTECRKTGNLSVQELRDAEIKVVQHEQRASYPQEVQCLLSKEPIAKTSPILCLNPFIDSDGLLRTQRRLEFSELEFDEKCPIVIPQGELSRLLIRHYHIAMKHSGVDTMITSLRARYWIIGLRRQAKKIKSSCIPCQIQDSAPCQQLTAPLPPERVKKAPLFSVCGIDFAGPLYCSDFPKKKLYVLLFTCAVVRAVHVELVDSMSVDDFLLGFIRFICRRSLPAHIISDNAKTFIAAKEKFIAHFGPRCPVWKFNAPLSPWWGAFWERMVRSIKSNLRKSVGNRLLTRCELETTLCEVESCVNSRPLTFVGDTLHSVHPLTPSHFLNPSGSAGTHDPFSEQKSDHLTLCDMYSERCRVIEMFWQRWSSEYLRNLPCMRTGKSKGNPVTGTLVMVRENDHHKRLQWPTGVVTQTFPGRDGLVRAVEVKTATGKITRPVQRIHVLEIASEPNLSGFEPKRVLNEEDQIDKDAPGASVEPDNSTLSVEEPLGGTDNVSVRGFATRGGRVSKKREILNL